MKVWFLLDQLTNSKLKAITFHGEKDIQSYNVDIKLPKNKVVKMEIKEDEKE